MNFKKFLQMIETQALNPLGGPTASGSTGMDFWSSKNAGLSVGKAFQNTGPADPRETWAKQRPSTLPPGPFSMIAGKAGPDANKGGKKGAFSRTQENPIVRPGSTNSPRGAGATWQPAGQSPFSLGKQVTTVGVAAKKT